jgi:hypothetical protein
LSGVETIGQIPFDLGGKIRDQAATLLRQPRSYSYHGACGGNAPDQQPRLVQETHVGRYEDSPDFN